LPRHSHCLSSICLPHRARLAITERQPSGKSDGHFASARPALNAMLGTALRTVVGVAVVVNGPGCRVLSKGIPAEVGASHAREGVSLPQYHFNLEAPFARPAPRISSPRGHALAPALLLAVHGVILNLLSDLRGDKLQAPLVPRCHHLLRRQSRHLTALPMSFHRQAGRAGGSECAWRRLNVKARELAVREGVGRLTNRSSSWDSMTYCSSSLPRCR
jgi:hypothetical protein